MYRPPGRKGDPGRWWCVPKDPAATTRADGCPWEAVKDGASCKRKIACTWGECGWNSAKGTCDGAQWHVKETRLPPPP
jgi:hypothetical protein